MIYFYYGTDSEKARKKAKATVDSLIQKKPDALLVKIGDEEISTEKIKELAGSQGLFSSKFIIYFRKTFENKNNKELILKNIKEISESGNIFIFAEEKTDKATITKIEKFAEKTEEFEKQILTKKDKLDSIGEKISFFEFTDALGSKDKKKLWGLYQDALKEKVPSEEVHGIFFWQIKSMLLAKNSKDAVEAGMNPFPFSKAKSFARNFNDGELEKISENLISMYHEAHRGNIDFPIALERFILEL